MNFFKKNYLLFVVFLTGASVLIIEVTAVRVLSPFYGNTIFTMSSIITVILTALSFGYYIGGKLADKRPSALLFFVIIFFSGCTLLILHVLGLILLPLLGFKLSASSGSFIASLFLFLVPSLLLGMLSPFVIKLQSDAFRDRGVGTISGQIFFWSTFGSITGSLLTGFVFIPRFGVNEIVFANSILLFILGLIPILILDKEKKYIYKIIIPVFIFVIFIGIGRYIENEFKKNIVYKTSTMYQNISIMENEWGNGRDVRTLTFSSNGVQSAIYLDEKNPTDLVFKYSKYYEIYKIFNPDIKNALVIGGGAYTIPRALLYSLPEAKIDVSEIDDELYEIAKKQFNLIEDERLTVDNKDGRRFLVDTNKKYDLIFTDAYGASLSVPSHLTTTEFFELSKSKLNNDGIFIANIVSTLSRQESSFLFSEIKTFQEIFPNSYFFATKSKKDINIQNIIFVGINSNKIFNLNSEKILSNSNPLLSSLYEKKINIDRFDMNNGIILRDNYVPVDYMNKDMFIKFKYKNKMREDEMMAIIKQQLDCGPRYLESVGHKKIQKAIIAEMEDLTDEVIIQEWTHLAKDGKEYELKNIIGKLNPEKKNRVLLAAHYDSKKFAHMDKRKPSDFMPGANDSGSGVAVLFDIARELSSKVEKMEIGVDFVFFDGEEGEVGIGGDFSHYETLGSTYFAKKIENIYSNNEVVSGIVVDMVADKDFKISKEPISFENSKEQVNKFWKIAQKENFKVFSDEFYGEKIIDDHAPLNEIGIPTFLLIDRNYKYWHTTKDTLDKCDGKSMRIISDSIMKYLKEINDNLN